MKRMTITLGLLAAMAATAGSQQMDHSQHGKAVAPCPLHLKTLELTPVQALIVDSIRATHSAAMKTTMPKHDSTATGMKMKMEMKLTDEGRALMEKSKAEALASIRAILTEPQRALFDAAVVAHKARMTAEKAAGTHDCMACCMECMKHDGHGALGETTRD